MGEFCKKDSPLKNLKKKEIKKMKKEIFEKLCKVFGKNNLTILNFNSKIRRFSLKNQLDEVLFLDNLDEQLLKQFNLGVKLDNFIIIDIDDKDLAEQFLQKSQTYTVKTRKGYHFYYKKPSDFYHSKIIKINSLPIDVLTGENNYVVAEGSEVDGFVYSAVRDENILQFGDDGVSEEVKQMIEQCKKEEKNSGADRVFCVKSGEGDVLKEVELCVVREGSRNKAVCELGGLLLKYCPVEQVKKILLEINDKFFCPKELTDVICKSVDSLYTAELKQNKKINYDKFKVIFDKDNAKIFVKLNSDKQLNLAETFNLIFQNNKSFFDKLCFSFKTGLFYLKSDECYEKLEEEEMISQLSHMLYKEQDEGVKVKIGNEVCSFFVKLLKKKCLQLKDVDVDEREAAVGSVCLGVKEDVVLTFDVNQKCRVEWADVEKSEFWQFISELFSDEEEREYILKSLAVSLFNLSIKNNQQMLYFMGRGSNGKSTFYNILKAVFKNYVTELPAGIFSKNTHLNAEYYLYNLKTARLVFVEELESQQLNEAFIKNLTGSSTFIARPPFGKPEEIKKNFLLIINSNTWPNINDYSDGMLRRFTPVHIKFKVVNPVFDFAKNLVEKECDIIIEVFKVYAEKALREGIKLPASVQSRREFLVSDNNVLQQFFNECFVEVPGSFIEAAEVFEMWKQWCEKEQLIYLAAHGRRWFYRNFTFVEAVKNWENKLLFCNITPSNFLL